MAIWKIVTSCGSGSGRDATHFAQADRVFNVDGTDMDLPTFKACVDARERERESDPSLPMCRAHISDLLGLLPVKSVEREE